MKKKELEALLVEICKWIKTQDSINETQATINEELWKDSDDLWDQMERFRERYLQEKDKAHALKRECEILYKKLKEAEARG